MGDNFGSVIHSGIWGEETAADNEYSAAVCRCRGYDVFGDLLGKASYIEYLFLLFKGERPSPTAAEALELLMVALANPGPRDPSVHAAMATGVGGSTSASVLMAAVAVGAGSYGGGREVFLAMEAWQERGMDRERWRSGLASPRAATRVEVWPEPGHSPGFAPHERRCAAPVLQTLTLFTRCLPEGQVAWLAREREALEAAADQPLAMMGVAAAVLTELGFSPVEGEMLTLLLRLPGAAVHALEQQRLGFRQFPFFELALENDPGPGGASQEERP